MPLRHLEPLEPLEPLESLEPLTPLEIPKPPIPKAITKNKKYEENIDFFTDDGIAAFMPYGTANTAEARTLGSGCKS